MKMKMEMEMGREIQTNVAEAKIDIYGDRIEKPTTKPKDVTVCHHAHRQNHRMIGLERDSLAIPREVF